MRYFKSQQIIALDHRKEEREFNRVLYNNCGVNVDSKVRYLEKTWLHEDDMQGVAESLVATATDGVAAVATAVRGLSSHPQPLPPTMQIVPPLGPPHVSHCTCQ